MRSGYATCFAVLLAAASGVHAAQHGPSDHASPGYPARPIRLIVSFPPGGSNDIMGRYFGHYLTERPGRQVVIDNRGGADGIIGTEIVVRAQPDVTRLLVISAAHTVNAATRKLPYDPLGSFAWPGHSVSPEPALRRSGAAGQFGAELLAYAGHPGKLTLATSGGYAHFSAKCFTTSPGCRCWSSYTKEVFPH